MRVRNEFVLTSLTRFEYRVFAHRSGNKVKAHTSHEIKAHVRRSMFCLLLHVAISVIPFAVAQRNATNSTILAFVHTYGPTKISHRTLTFAERAAYQRAIEEVYWRHRIWPKERPDPKPFLNAVMSRAQLEKKVADYLRKSQALEDYWQRPITTDQLKAEMERMASDTKQPEVLRELFEALGNDPFVIAECLAKPLLAERLVCGLFTQNKARRLESAQIREARDMSLATAL